MIYSATAFHWIPEKLGYEKVFRLLKNGGAFARFANHPYKDKGREKIHQALQKLYSVYMPGSLEPNEYSERNAKERARIAEKYGFVDIKYKLYTRTRTFTAEEYVALLGTYSGAKAECGTVVWNDDIDIAPEHLYENSVPYTN